MTRQTAAHPSAVGTGRGAGGAGHLCRGIHLKCLRREPEEMVYGDNVMDIDFEGLMASDEGNLLAMDQYFAAQTPTKQNDYTGLFAGKT